MDKKHLEVLTKVLKEIYKENNLSITNIKENLIGRLRREGLLD